MLKIALLFGALAVTSTLAARDFVAPARSTDTRVQQPIERYAMTPERRRIVEVGQNGVSTTGL